MIKAIYLGKTALLAMAALGASAPAWAGTSDSVRQAVSPDALDALGAVPSSKDKQAFAAVFAAIDGKNWSEAAKLIDTAPKGPMASMARAELYLAAGSPKVEAAQLQALLEEAPWLPQAEQLEKMAIKRGVADLPVRPGTRRFSFLGSAPKRDLPDSNQSASALRSKLQELIKADNPAGAEALLNEQGLSLDSDALTELRYRVAW
ncbi:MAG: lytic transglycosylase domain-containing protein, partial [Sphingorhabdus sp.]|nr:lytic transglycosylase domain-containing protein [Sphingorhabdus sp.]